MAKKFIDVSEFQGDIDWKKAKPELQGVYIRCGLRGSLAKTAPQDYKKIRFDKYWKKNLEAVTTLGIPFGPYYFPTAITETEAIEEAKWFYSQVKDLKLSFVPMLDSENVWGKDKEPGRANGLSRADRTRFLRIITDYFNSRGMNIGIYASANWLITKIDMSVFPKRVRDCTWVADSTAPVDYTGYYWLHQYGKGPCAGCSDDVDLNKVTNTIPIVKTSITKKASPEDVVIEIAESQIGYKEGANNHTKYGDEMHSIQPSNMDKNAAWCDAFVDWCIYKMCQKFGYGADMARKVLCGTFDDYTYNSVNLYKKAGRWTQSPKRAYQIFFGGSGHTGIVTSVESGKVYTIEGNKSNAVRRCSYNISDPSIIGYGMPRYDLIKATIPIEESEADMLPVLKQGSTGTAVKWLQIALGGLTVDGDFGWKTMNKVLEFQRTHGLATDGEVGPKTWRAIINTL